MGERDFEDVNRMAMDQISKLEQTDTKVPTVPSFSSSRGDFWKSDYARPSWRPSSQGETSRVPLLGSTPRSYYTSRELAGGYGNPDGYYRKTLNAIYRQEKTENEEVDKTNEETEMVVLDINPNVYSLRLGGTLFDDVEITGQRVERKEQQQQTAGPMYTVRAKPMKMPKISQDTKNQMLAIVLSGFSRVASTMILNWAKERRVPYELL